MSDATTGKRNSDRSWLARVPRKDGTVENDYNSEDFSQVLAGRLAEMTGNSLGPGAYLHANNVSIAYTHLYGMDVEGTGANASLVTRTGDQGSVAQLRIPAGAGLLHKAWNIVVGPELTWSAVATTTDFASEAQAVTARNSLQYIWEQEGFGSQAKAAMFETMAFAECAIHAPWDPTLGEDLSVELVGEGEDARERLLKTGDVSYRRISTWDILRDPSARSHADLTWIVVREWPDRYDVAEMCDTEEARQAALTSTIVDAPIQGWAPWQAMRQYIRDLGDRIPVYYLYCRRTPSVPAGRQTVFLQDGTIISDGPLDERYHRLPPRCIGPVRIIYADEYRGTAWPYSKNFATLGAEQAADGLYGDLLTNATAISGPVIAAPDDMMDAVASTQIGGGPRVIPVPPGRAGDIKTIEVQSAHPDHFKLIGTLRNETQQIWGIDNITAGQEVGANLSGAAMALMTSTSVQNNSQWQKVWAEAVQDVGTITLRHIQRMPTPKRIALAGNARASLVTTTEVTGAQVSGIERVLVSLGNALQQTDAGRYTLLETAMDKGWVKTPEQAQEVLDTGRYDALSEDLSNELLLIRSENEAIARGEDVPVMLEDNHTLHIKRHAAVAASLTARKDPNVIRALQAHNDNHLRMLREGDPALLAATGQQSLAASPAGAGAPNPDAQSATKPPQQAQEQQQAKAPSPPKNPATGQEARPVAGTPPPALAVKPN